MSRASPRKGKAGEFRPNRLNRFTCTRRCRRHAREKPEIVFGFVLRFEQFRVQYVEESLKDWRILRGLRYE